MSDSPKTSKFFVIWSIFWVVLIVLVILWFLAMSLMGDKVPEQPLDKADAPTQQQIDDFVKKANSPNASSQDLWLYAHLINNTETRAKLPPINEGIDKKVNSLISQSAKLGNCDALYEQAIFNIQRSFAPNNLANDSVLSNITNYPTENDQIYNFDTLNQGIDTLIDLENRKDCVYHSSRKSGDNLLKYINHLELQETPSLLNNYSILSYLNNPNLQHNFDSYQKFAILSAYESLGITHSAVKELIISHLHQLLDPQGKVKFDQFYPLLQDGLLAKLINDNELYQQIYQKIPTSQQSEFERLNQQLVKSYKANFKPVQTASTTASNHQSK